MNKHDRIDNRLIYLLSFLIPLGVMIGCMIWFGVQPFGDKSFLIIDGLHQYMPFFSVLYDKLKSGEGLLYSFRIGLGVNFLSLFSYYLSSPLNLFILLFRKTQLNMAVSLLVVFKIALSGLTAGIYFSRKCKKPDLTVVAAACIYALNSYMVGYSWNVMWLDAIMIFPIIMLGIEKLIEDSDGRLYCLALFYALYCNYYIAFMICIFAVIWYLIYSFSSVRQFFFRGFVFAFYSLLAAGMAAVVLIPAYLGIRQTASGNAFVLPAHAFETGLADLLARQFDLSAPISHDNFDGNINLYFGMVTVFTSFLYFLNGEIRLFEKIKKALLIIFFYVSFSEKILNFIWHGFHDQYGIPNRFSFLLGFVFIGMFVEVMEHRKAVRNWQTVLCAALSVGLLYYSYYQASQPLEEKLYGIAGVLIVLYGTIMLLMTMDKKRKTWYVRIISLVTVVELCAAAVLGYDQIGQISVTKFFSSTEDMEEAVTALDDGTFYRSELADARLVDESSWYRLHGISLFGSTAMEHTVDIMDSLGFYTGCNEYLYKGANPLTNLMLDVRYLYFHPEDSLRTDFVYRDSYGDMSVYENPNRNMSIGYVLDDAIENWYYTSAYPFRVLNDFSYQGYSIDGIFRDIPIPEPETKGCTADNTNDGEYHFFFKEADDDNMVFTIPAAETIDKLYLFYDGTQVDNARIAVDGENIIDGDKDGTMLYAGKVEAGSAVTVRFKLKGETEDGYVRLSVAAFDQELFDRLAGQMGRQAFQISGWSYNHIEGKAVAGPDQMLYFSIPYDEGWKILVDGETVQADMIGNAFLALPLEEGEHTISMTYRSPGFSIGWKLSLACWIMFLIMFFSIPRIRMKKRIPSVKPQQLNSVSKQDTGNTQYTGD